MKIIIIIITFSEEDLSKSLNKLNISTDCIKKNDNLEDNTIPKTNESDGLNTNGKKILPLNLVRTSKIGSVRPAAPPPPPPNREGFFFNLQ